MSDFQNPMQEMMRKAYDESSQRIRERQTDMKNQQHHDELLAAQQNISDSNIRVADEVNGVRHTLQAQIDTLKEQLNESKITERKLAKRSWLQFGISLAISLASLAVAIFLR